MTPAFVPQIPVCRADRNGGPNYGKPHVWVDGTYGGEPRRSCAYCGMWEDAATFQINVK